MALKLFLITVPYWIVFTLDLIYDFHLLSSGFGTIVKLLFLVCVIINIAGAVYGKIELSKNKDSKIQSIGMIVLNLMPLIGIGSVVFWWLFIFKM